MTARLRMPFDREMNYGRALNEEMELLPEGDWAIFLDHDAHWLTVHWHSQIEEAVAFQPDAGLFGAMANRIGPKWQQAGPGLLDDRVLCPVAEERRRKARTLLDVTDTKGIGGVVMVISKTAWREVGGFVDGMGCVDHMMHFAQARAGRKVFIIEGLLVAHRRGTSGNLNHMPYAKDCPCRGPEQMPMRRMRLP